MFAGNIDCQEFDDMSLARTHPEAYAAKMEAKRESNPIKDLITFFKKLIAKRAK